MAGQTLHKFKLLMWHKCMLTLRDCGALSTHLWGLILLLGMLYSARIQVKVINNEETIYSPFDVSGKEALCEGRNETSVIAYSPNSSFLRNEISTICEKATILQFENEDKLNAKIASNTSFAQSLLFAINFNDEIDSRNLPDNLKVTIRLPSYMDSKQNVWWTNNLYPQSPSSTKLDGEEEAKGGQPYYHKRGFLYLQRHMALAFINSSQLQIKSNRFPYPKREIDQLYTRIAGGISRLYLAEFLYMCSLSAMINSMALEKENQLKESMKVMGLPVWLYWLSWFLVNLTILTIILLLVVIITSTSLIRIFTNSDTSAVIVFLLLFACSSITFSFIFCALFSKAVPAGIIAFLVYFAFGNLGYYMSWNNEFPERGGLAACLLCPVAAMFGLLIIFKFEAAGEGMHWRNIWSNKFTSSKLTFGIILIMLAIDTILYCLIALYLDQIFPGEFGVPQPWYFPFMPSYWRSKAENSESTDDNIGKNRGSNFEQVTEKRPVGIKLINLSKNFGTHAAVKSLNLEMYQGHITVLLGHNGAGKTVTMSMIGGMFRPSNGTAIVNDYDVTKNLDKARESMGLCFQHNVLFDVLTVTDHLYFFGALKGLKGDELKKEIDRYIETMDLEEKRKERSRNLSGGMKRKLCVAIALIGNSKVVILDEPTAEMDPFARRAIWSLLQEEKRNRTILLTTHLMDEADVLGDRIAIMRAGELECCGSSFFLKRKYETGYYLVLDVAPNCQPDRVTTYLRKYIPYVQIHSYVGSELVYRLAEKESSKFENILYDLESDLNSLNVRSLGISLATLEEVFIKSGAKQHTVASKTQIRNENKVPQLSSIGKISYYSGCSLLGNQFLAMLMKKVLLFIKSWMTTLFQIVIPILFLLLYFLMTRLSEDQNVASPALELSLDSYDDPITLIAGNENDHYKQYQEIVKGRLDKVEDINVEILKRASESPGKVKESYIVAASFGDDLVTAWFNGDAYHSAPLALSLVLNVIYKNYHGKERSINFVNHPLPLDPQDQIRINSVNIILPMLLTMGMIWSVAFFLLFYVKERACQARHLQIVSGVNACLFWGVSFLCDFLLYLLVVSGVLITLIIFQEDGFKTSAELICLAIVLLCFGFFVLPFIYLFSNIFSGMLMAMNVFVILGLLTAMIVPIAVMFLKLLERVEAAIIVDWVFLFIPFYLLYRGIRNLSLLYILGDICKQYGDLELACKLNEDCCAVEDYYSFNWFGTGRAIIVALAMGILLYLSIICAQYGVFSFIITKLCYPGKGPVQKETIEPDVKDENYKIQSTRQAVLCKTCLLVLRNVTKYYKRCKRCWPTNFVAVNGICLGVRPSECFGLLGVNGAGKTTTFKMLTGETQMTYGDIWINELNRKTNLTKINKLTGYCPQQDAFFEVLTPRETIKIFALIRGIPYSKCDILAENLAQDLGFSEYLDKKCKNLSGGNKRKLSTALATIGDPSIIYLDEPTAGIDPSARRIVWNALARLRDSGKCIVLTSHNMEECEALCTRITIMVNGNFECLGSVQRLKNKFAQGYKLTVKVTKDIDNLDNQVATITSFVERQFPGGTLKERYQELLFYELPKSNIPLSKMFGTLERNKGSLRIEDYSLGQCSLEKVFVSFAENQEQTL